MKGAKHIISRYLQDREGTLPHSPYERGRAVASMKEKIENSKKPDNVKKSPSASPDSGVGPKVDRSRDFLQDRLEKVDGHIITLMTH